MKIEGLRKLAILTFTLLVGLINLAVSHDTYSTTGHEEFSSLTFKQDDVRLLKDMKSHDMDFYYKQCKWKFFGWSTYYLYEYVDCDYVSKTIFSRSNRTSMPFGFDYSLQEVIYDESSYSFKGSINVKESGKLKKVEISSQQQADITISGDYYVKTTETGSLSITVNPGKKMTLRVAGDGKMSTCFGKYYFMGICMKKGAYECVDIIGSFFELVETDA